MIKYSRHSYTKMLNAILKCSKMLKLYSYVCMCAIVSSSTAPHFSF